MSGRPALGKADDQTALRRYSYHLIHLPGWAFQRSPVDVLRSPPISRARVRCPHRRVGRHIAPGGPRQAGSVPAGPLQAGREVSRFIVNAIAALAAQRARLRRIYRGWWIVALAFYSQLVTIAAGGYVFGALILSMQRDLGWSQSAIVGPLTLNRFISGFLAVPLGPLIDRYGARVSMTISAVLAGIALIGVAFAHDPVLFYGAWALFGIAQPGLGLLGPRVVIANWFVRKRAKAFVIFTLGSSAAGLIAVPIAAIIDERYGWRIVWVILGALCISVAPLSWWAIRRRPEDMGLLPDGDAAEEAAGAGRANAAANEVARDLPWTVSEALRTRSFWLLTVGFLLVSMPGGALFLNISGFVQSHGFTRADGAGVVMAYAFGSFGARPLWGFFLTRVGLHRTLIVFGAIYGTTIVWFALQTGLVSLYVAALLLGFGISGSQLLNAQALPDYYGRRIVGSLTGYSTLANVAVGGAAPQVVAIVFDRTGGYVPAFLFFAVACWVAAVAFAFAPPPVHPSERSDGRAEAPAGAASA